MAKRVHCPSYVKYRDENPDTVLAACCDLNEESAETIRRDFGFEKAYTDYKKMLENEKPDAVCLIVPVRFTAEIAENVMNMGFNILMEKPPGINKAETEKLICAAKKSGVINMVAFNRRHTPLMIKLKELLKGEEIHNINCDLFRVARKESHFYTTAIHCIDAIKYIAGADYKKVSFQQIGRASCRERV